jgi:hypothetical protein
LQFFPLKHHMQHLKWESSWNTSKQHPYQVLNPLSPFSKHHKLQPMRLHAKETKPRPPTIPTLCKPSINTYPTSETNHSATKHITITQTPSPLQFSCSWVLGVLSQRLELRF